MAVRAGDGFVGVGHRTAGLEDGVAVSAEVLVERHRLGG